MQDIKELQLGQLVDFCIEYKERHSEEKEKQAPKYRLASKSETSAYFGG